MAYPTGTNWQVTSPEIGVQQINVTSTVQNHPTGKIVRARDATYGEGEFMYAKGVANTVPGDMCAIDPKGGAAARAVAGTNFGVMGVAMSANVASQWGWYCINGAVPTVAATVAAGAKVNLTATAGTIDDAVSAGNSVDGAWTGGSDSGGFATAVLSRPSANKNDEPD